MHIKALTKPQPVSAQEVEILLDIINQLLGTLRAFETFLGIDFSCKFFSIGDNCDAP